MQKNLLATILGVVCIVLIGYIVYNKTNSNFISSSEAQAKAEKFINEVLLQPGVTANFLGINEASGLYKLSLSLPEGGAVDTYITKDGELFFPEAMNIAQITEQANINSQVNNQNQMDLQIETLVEGTGEQMVQLGDSIAVDYTGTLEDGTQFDSSIGKQPFTFTIGQGSVIQGWEQGLVGMKVGEERKLTIPSELGYGSTGSGAIPPNATLIFTIKLISIN